MDNTNDTLDERRWARPSFAASAAASAATNNNKRKVIPRNGERRRPKQNVRSLIRDNAGHIIMPTPSSVAVAHRKTQSPTTPSRNRRRGRRENSRRNQAYQGDHGGGKRRDDDNNRRHLAANSIRNKAGSGSPRPRRHAHKPDVPSPSLSYNSINANEDNEEYDVIIDTRRRESRDRERQDRMMWSSTGSNQPQKQQKAASQNKACRKGKGCETPTNTTPSDSAASRKNNPSSTLPSNHHRSQQNVHTRFSNPSDDDNDNSSIERLNRKIGRMQNSTTQEEDGDHTIGTSSRRHRFQQSAHIRIQEDYDRRDRHSQFSDCAWDKSVASPLTLHPWPPISQLEDHRDNNGTKRKSDAAADLASTPSKRIRRRHNSWEVDRGTYYDNNHSAVHSSAKSTTFELQNEEYSERLNRGVGRRGRGSRGDGKDDTRRNVSPRKEGAATATATAKKSDFRGNHHSPSSLTHSVPSKTMGRQRFDTLNLRMRHFEDEDSYYPDSKNGTKRQSYNDTTIVSRQQNKCSTDSVDEWGIADIRAETPLRFSNTGMMHKEEEEDIVACDQRDSPENRQATTPKRTPPATGLADRWESPPSSASPLWSFGVKNHKNVSKTAKGHTCEKRRNEITADLNAHNIMRSEALVGLIDADAPNCTRPINLDDTTPPKLLQRPTALENINIKDEDTILTSNHEASCDKVDSNIIILNPNKDDILCGQTMKGKEFYPGNIALLGKQGTTPDLTESNNEEIIPSKLLTQPAMLESDINIADTMLDSNTIVLNPNNDDILCGYNTKRRAEHPGNIALRRYIEAKKAACNYKQLGKCEKTAVIDQTITHFKEIGRFLVDDTAQKGFRNADDSTIRVKVKRAFTDQSKIGNMDECVSVLHPTDTGSVLDENDNADHERGVGEDDRENVNKRHDKKDISGKINAGKQGTLPDMREGVTKVNDEANEQAISVVNEVSLSSTKEPNTKVKPLSLLARRKLNDSCDDKKGIELKSRTLNNDGIDANATSHSIREDQAAKSNLDNTHMSAIGGRAMADDNDASDEDEDGDATITHLKGIGRFLVEDTTQSGFRNADDSLIREKVMKLKDGKSASNDNVSCDGIDAEEIILFPNDNDILCGTTSVVHPGNQAFRDYVAKVVATCDHKRLTSDNKRALCDQIMEHFKSTSRFLVRDTGRNGYRVEVDHRKIKKKVDNCFYYCLFKQMSDGGDEELIVLHPDDTNILQTTILAATSDMNTISEETINDRNKIQAKEHPKYAEWNRSVDGEELSDAGRSFDYNNGEVNADEREVDMVHFSSTSVDKLKPLSFPKGRKPNNACDDKKRSELESRPFNNDGINANAASHSIREDQAAEANLDDSEHTAIGGKTMEADYDASDEVADGGAVDEGDDDANSVSSTKSYYRDLCVRLTFALEKKNSMESQTRIENQRLKEEIAQLRR